MLFLKNIRLVQILALTSLFCYGVWRFDLSLLWVQVPLTLISGLLTQLFWMRRLKLKTHSCLSALITCLSLFLLLRSHYLWIHPLAAFIAINSKFLIQYKRQHFFNPSAFGLFVVLLWEKAWLSPGQWGSGTSMAVWIVACGFLVVSQMRQISTAWLFVVFYLGGLLIRSLYLGYEMAVFYHGALNGSLLLFTFFMISDPRTSPHHFIGQVIFSLFVAGLALVFHYCFFVTNGLIYALVAGGCLVPFLNHRFPAHNFQWNLELRPMVAAK